MYVRKIVVISLVPIMLLFMACAAREAPSLVGEVTLPPAREEEKVRVKEEWQAKWDKALQAAKVEGRVVVYGGSAALALKNYATPIIKKKFGLELEVLASRGAEVIAKITAERNYGLYIPDIYVSGSSEAYQKLKPMGAIDPIEPALMLPEVLDQKAWFWGMLPWGDEERKVLIWPGFPAHQMIVNTNMVKPGDFQSFRDLMDPKWKGKIAVNDPSVGSGSGFYNFNTIIYNKVVDADFFRQLIARQQITLSRDQLLQLQWLALGKFSVGLWASSGRMAEYKKEGAPITSVALQGATYLSGGGGAIALMNKAPHPNAARIFLNWLLGKEGQLLLQNNTRKQSIRIDIPTNELEQDEVRQPGIKYLPDPNALEKWVLEDEPKYLELAREIFRP